MSLHNTKHSEATQNPLITLVILAAFATTAGIGIFTFTLPLLSFDEKASGVWLGTAFAGYFLAKMVIAPVSGKISDQIGPKPLLLCASFLSLLLPLSYLSIESKYTIYIIQLGLGFTGGIIKTVTMALIGSYSKNEEMPFRFSTLSAAFNAAFFISPLLGGWLYINRNFTPVLWGVAIWMTIAFFIFTFAVPNSASTRKNNPPNANPDSNPGLMSKLPLFLAIAGRTAGIGTLMTFYPVLLKTRLSINSIEAGLLFTVPNLTAFFLLPAAGRMLAKYNHRKTTAAGMLISSAGLYLMTLPYSIAAFIFLGIVIGIGSALSIPASMTLSSGLNRKQGRSHGAANMAANFGFLAGPLLAGLAIKLSGNTEAALQLAGFIGIALCVPLLGEGFLQNSKIPGIAAKIRTAAISVSAIILALSPFFITTNSPHTENMEETYRFTDVAMGTVVNFTIESKSSSKAEEAAKTAIKSMRSLQKDFDHRSRYGSVGTLNREAGKEPVAVTDRAYTLISHGLEFGRNTGGVFDITIGAVTDAPFYYALSEKLLKSKKNLVDYRRVKLFPESKKVYLPIHGMALDLGGLAKGTILDAAGQTLRKSGIDTAMIEGGGDFCCFGNREWVIGLRNPRGAGLLGTIKVRNKGVCGSGDYYQFIITGKKGDEKRRHHIIDIKSMESADNSIATTVLAPDAETADALATTVFILGPVAGKKMLKKYYPECSAMWVLPDMSMVKTANFPQISAPPKS